MSVTIDSLEIEVGTNAKVASDNLDELTASLRSLKSSGITDVSTALSRLNGELKTLKNGSLKSTMAEIKREVRDAADDINASLDVDMVHDDAILYESTKTAQKNHEAWKKIDDAVKQATASTQKYKLSIHQASEKTSVLLKSFKRIVMYRAIYSIMKVIENGLQEGLSTAYQFSHLVNGSLAQGLDSIKSSASQMQNQLGAMSAEFLNVFAPLLIHLMSALTSVVDHITEVLAALNGESTYLKANLVATSWEDATDAVSAYKHQLVGLDELNNISTSSSSSTAKDYSSLYTETPISDSLKSLSKIKMTIDNITWDFDSLSGDELGKAFCERLGGIIGAGIGFTYGGVGGAIIGAIAGVVITTYISDLLFDISENGWNADNGLKLLASTMSLLAGAAIGFKYLGGAKGALIGATVGIALTCAIESVAFAEGDDLDRAQIQKTLGEVAGAIVGGVLGFAAGGITGGVFGASLGISIMASISNFSVTTQGEKKYKDSAAYQHIQDIKEEIEEESQIAIDIGVRIADLSADVSSEDLAKLEYAKDLISGIFSLDGIEVKTPSQISEIKSEIDELNLLNLDGIALTFDDATGHVTQTKAEVYSLIDALENQYKIEGYRQAIIEAYELEAEAVSNVKSAQKKLTSALTAQTVANEKVEAITSELADTQAIWNSTTGKGVTKLINYNSKVKELETSLSAAKSEQEDATSAVNSARTALTNASTNVTNVKSKIDSLTTSFKEMKTSIDNSVTSLENLASVKVDTRTVDYGNGNTATNVPDSVLFAMIAAGATVTTRANGGYVSGGHLFFANENGNPEYIGNMGGTTAVANSGQMAEAIESASYAGMSRALQQYGKSNSSDGYEPMSGDDVFVFLRKKASAYSSRTGNPAFN